MVFRKMGLNWRHGAGQAGQNQPQTQTQPQPDGAVKRSYLVHACVSEEQRGVVQRDGGRRVHVHMLVADEEVDELLANLSCSQSGVHSEPALWRDKEPSDLQLNILPLRRQRDLLHPQAQEEEQKEQQSDGEVRVELGTGFPSTAPSPCR